MHDFEKEVFFSNYCSVLKTENKLIIQTNFSTLSLFYRVLILVIISFAIFSSCLLIIINQIISGIAVLFFLSVFCLYLYHEIRKHTWDIDKSSQIITLQKVFSYWKKIQTYNFSEIGSLIYQKDHRDYGDMHKLVFVYKNADNIKIFKGRKGDCKKLGIIISNFMNKIFEYKP